MKKISVERKRSSPKSVKPRAPTRYVLKKNIMYREVEGQILILTAREELLYTLNASGQVLWGLLARGTTEQKLVSALASRYKLTTTQARRDVRAFLRELSAKGIVARK